MQVVTTIGFDIAKSVFQIHEVDAHGKVVVRRQLRRRYVLPFFKKLSPCLVGIEAYATSHYHRVGELGNLGASRTPSICGVTWDAHTSIAEPSPRREFSLLASRTI